MIIQGILISELEDYHSNSNPLNGKHNSTVIVYFIFGQTYNWGNLS